MAFPCNQFGGQEPDALDEILEKTARLYGRTFPLMDKVDVKGPDAIPLYKWLNEDDKLITWNFHKFLIDRQGQVVGSYKPKVSPAQLEPEIVRLLGVGAKH